MKKIFLKLFFLLCLTAVWATGLLNAQTVLVHGEPGSAEPDENRKLFNQSAEAGIMDVLFEKGFIVFSDLSETDESGIRNLAVKTGSDYIISWNLIDSGLKGSLVALSGNRSLGTATVVENDLKDVYRTPSDLYAAMGSTLCTSLVGDIW